MLETLLMMFLAPAAIAAGTAAVGLLIVGVVALFDKDGPDDAGRV